MARQLLFRTAQLDVADDFATTKAVRLSFSSELPVLRKGRSGQYWEKLSHGPGDANFGIINTEGVVLENHDDTREIGGVVQSSARIEKDKKARADITLSDEPWNKRIAAGERPGVSVGYVHLSVVREEEAIDGIPVRVFSWSPYEISLLNEVDPADNTVGIGRAAFDKNKSNQDMNNNLKRSPDGTDGGGTETDTKVNVEEITRKARTDELARSKGINAAVSEMSKAFQGEEIGKKLRALGEQAISEGTSISDFNASLLKELPGYRKLEETQTLGMTQKEIKNFSFGRAIRGFVEKGRVEGFEKEISDAWGKKVGQSAEGFWIPSDIVVGNGQRSIVTRDTNVTTPTQGGDFVQTTIQTPIIEILRNRTICMRLGVQTLAGLQGNIAIPRQTGAATAYSVSEQAAITKSTQAIDQIALTPKRIGAWNNYTKQSILQSSVDVENFIRNDLMQVLAIKIDKLILEGSGGSSEPTGIAATTGVGVVHFGAAATWAKVLSFETALAAANADVGNMAYATTPATRAKWKAAVKVATTNTAGFLWEIGVPIAYGLGNPGDYGTGAANFGVVNGYTAAATNQIASDHVFFGNWADEIVGMWGGFDVVVDNYSVAEQAVVRIIVNVFMDCALRHGASFAVSDDSGAQ